MSQLYNSSAGGGGGGGITSVVGGTNIQVNTVMGTATVSTTSNVVFNGGTFDAGTDATDNDINIGTGASAGRIVALGSDVAGSQTIINAGGGSLLMSVTNAGGMNISVDGGFVLATSTGTVNINAASTLNIANQNVNANVNIGTAGTRVLTMGSAASTSSVVVQCGTGGASFGANATSHLTTLGSATGTSTTNVQCGTGGATIATGAAVHATTVGGTNGASSTTIQAGTGGLNLSATNSNITLSPGTGSLFLNGSQSWPLTPVATTYAVLNNDQFISYDSSGGSFTITLPASPVSGRYLVIYDTGGDSSANPVTVDGNGNNLLISGSSNATFALNSSGNALLMWFNGTNWLCILTA